MKTALIILLCIQGMLSLATSLAWLCGRGIHIYTMPRWMGRLLRGYWAVTFYPLGVFIQQDLPDRIRDRVILHEGIHVVQQGETAGLFFLWYVIEYLLRRTMNDHRTAYHAIAFEAEAYDHDGEPDYLERREPFAFEEYYHANNRKI